MRAPPGHPATRAAGGPPGRTGRQESEAKGQRALPGVVCCWVPRVRGSLLQRVRRTLSLTGAQPLPRCAGNVGWDEVVVVLRRIAGMSLCSCHGDVVRLTSGDIVEHVLCAVVVTLLHIAQHLVESRSGNRLDVLRRLRAVAEHLDETPLGPLGYVYVGTDPA